MEQVLDNIIKDKLNIPSYKKFIDTNLLESKNYFRLFADITKSHVMSYNNIEGVLKPIGDTVVKIIDERKLVNGYSFYLEEENLNVICINSSVLIKLMELSIKFVENPNFFSNIGQVSNYVNHDIKKTKIEDGKIVWSTMLKDKTRQDLAFIIFYFGCSMLIYHEAGHLIHGHTHLCKENGYEFLSILEMADNQTYLNDNKKYLYRQTVEMDADAYASSHIWYTLENFYKNRFEMEGAFISSKNMMCEILICSISIFYILMNNESSNKNIDVAKCSHFPSYYRFVLAIDSIIATIKNIGTNFIAYEDLYNFAPSKFWKCIDIYNQININSNSKEDIKDNIEQESILKQHNIVKKYWNKLRKILMKFSYVELPPEYDDFN